MQLKSSFFQVLLQLENNFFDSTRAIWGTCFQLEMIVYVKLMNNTFLNQMSETIPWFDGINLIGIGSIMALTGKAGSALSIYEGVNNTIINSYSDTKGKLFLKQYI